MTVAIQVHRDLPETGLHVPKLLNALRVESDGSGFCSVCSRLERGKPSGRVIRFTVEDASRQASSIWEISSSGGSAHALFPALSHPTDRWGAGAGFGSWTRDGRLFFFVVGHNSGNSRMAGIWAMRESTGLFGTHLDPKQIYLSPLLSGPPVPSQDGRQLFFPAYQEDRELMKFDPRQQRFLTWFNGSSVGSVTYSPDNAWVSYVSYPDGVLWRARADGSQPLRLAELPALPFAPSFSPDGKSIAFHDARDSSGSRICIVPRDGGLSVSLTQGDDSSATWFPDGNSILYLHRAVAGVSGGDPPGIYRINVSSKNNERIPGSEAANDPALSPDGRFIAAPSKDFQHLMLFDFVSGKWRQLAGGSFLRSPRWSSDSQSVYFQDYYQGTEQPIYHVRISDGHIDAVATSAQFQCSDVFHGYMFHGLAPDGQPIVSLLRNKSDIFALNLDLP